ncbi:hypothetical protein LF844_23075 [Metapseudomonas lalkuanensis]|uniref:helix-turn-helix domain-containing protein n=1 Tax=Metapseudomonas lalkuanensis TaxID=2604832 RepID=UPI001CF3D00D|nr:helix-turn-helix domain-containing protein [Pseudomonas lalkuanensis]UCO97511.1 hypothetical protein LF844_23075 [Pseudomonas lalkuanensis]
MRKWDNATRDDLLTAVECIKHQFAPDAARNLIEYFHERMEDGDYYDVEVLHLLMKHVFALIVAGKSADQAFGLKAIKGQHNRPDTFARDISAAALVVKQRRKGASWEAAVTDAAEHLGLNNRTVERAFEAYREGVECLPDEQLEQITGDQLPPP